MTALWRTRNLALLLLFLTVVLFIILNITSPDSIGAGGILLVFGYFYLVSFVATNLVFRLILNKREVELSDSGNFMLVATVAGVPIIALALQSLGQLFFRDMIILVGITAMTIFYWVKRG